MRNTSTRGLRLRVSTAATADLVVPRSTPIRNGVAGISRGLALADVQLEFPALNAVFRLAPELNCPDLGDPALERHRDDAIVCRRITAWVGIQRHLERTELFEIVAPVFDDRRRRIAFANRRRDEPELRRLADRESEFSSRDRRARALFHPERHDAERLEWRRESRHGRQRAFDADVV